MVAFIQQLTSRAHDIVCGLRYRTQKKPHFLIILGMHRSGTSLAARTIGLMGIPLGPVTLEEFDGEVRWESPTVIWINDEILNRNDGAWNRPPQSLSFTSRDRWRVRRVLWNYPQSPVVAVKEPRMVLTWPLWQSELPEHTAIAVIRHPLNVALSLEKRDGIPLQEGLELWRVYNEQLLRWSNESPQPVMWFDFDAGKPALQALVCDISRTHGLPTDEAMNHYSERKRHHREKGPDLPNNIAQLYAELQDRARRYRMSISCVQTPLEPSYAV
jgi:hypothetical protein